MKALFTEWLNKSRLVCSEVRPALIKGLTEVRPMAAGAWAKTRPVLFELWVELVVPAFIIAASFALMAGYYVVLAYFNIVKMLLRELFISMEKPEVSPGVAEQTRSVAKSMARAMKLTVEEPMKLFDINEIPDLAKPLTVAELRKLAQAAGIKGARNMRKEDLLLALEIKE